MKYKAKDWVSEYPLDKGLLAMMSSPHVCRKSASIEQRDYSLRWRRRGTRTMHGTLRHGNWNWC